MPQGATELVQEGIILPPVRLERRGVPDDSMMELILANVRTPDERRGDRSRAALAPARPAPQGWRALVAARRRAAAHRRVQRAPRTRSGARLR